MPMHLPKVLWHESVDYRIDTTVAVRHERKCLQSTKQQVISSDAKWTSWTGRREQTQHSVLFVIWDIAFGFAHFTCAGNSPMNYWGSRILRRRVSIYLSHRFQVSIMKFLDQPESDEDVVYEGWAPTHGEEHDDRHQHFDHLKQSVLNTSNETNQRKYQHTNMRRKIQTAWLVLCKSAWGFFENPGSESTQNRVQTN